MDGKLGRTEIMKYYFRHAESFQLYKQMELFTTSRNEWCHRCTEFLGPRTSINQESQWNWLHKLCIEAMRSKLASINSRHINRKESIELKLFFFFSAMEVGKCFSRFGDDFPSAATTRRANGRKNVRWRTAGALNEKKGSNNGYKVYSWFNQFEFLLRPTFTSRCTFQTRVV